jgi:hypothetical protein
VIATEGIGKRSAFVCDQKPVFLKEVVTINWVFASVAIRSLPLDGMNTATTHLR